MAKLFPETTLRVDGRVYRLVLDINAQTLAEEAASTPQKEVAFTEIAESALRGRITASRLLFWASLQRHQPEITLAQAGDLLSQEEAMAAMREAAKETVPDPQDVKEMGADRPRKAQLASDGTGARLRLKSAVGG